ncbi:MAG TPA: IS1595 family transposase [Rhizomicrobium sp.]|nr:IS1595 family transposase [Rhizomicrobium sp.]
MASKLSAPHFTNEEAALAFVEAWLWPNGPVCPHCGETERVGRLSGATTRAGLCKCYACQKPFTVKMGTVFEATHAPMRLWLQAIYLMCSSKKGISTRQLQRTLGVGMKTAWHMGHRIRLAMAPAGDVGPLGGHGKIVEADETYLLKADGKRKAPGAGGYAHKMKVLSLTERGGLIRSKRMVDGTKAEIVAALHANVDPDSILHTDGAQAYKFTYAVAAHESVDHSKQYVRKGKSGNKVHTNTLEGYFSVFKRGMVGIYQHVGEQHLDRYLAEFDFRQNTRAKFGIDDVSRAAKALEGFKGKRLTYRTTVRTAHH